MKYSEKLRDPRWQRRRLQIMERDNWRCQLCFDDESTLHVHHVWYAGRDPWDAPDEALITLCHECHEENPPTPLNPILVEREEMDAYFRRCEEMREDDDYAWESMQYDATALLFGVELFGRYMRESLPNGRWINGQD